MPDLCKNKIRDAFQESLQELNDQHEYLIKNEVQEESVTFHIARILYQKLHIEAEDNIELDIEYNKKEGNPKSTDSDNEEVFDEIRCFLSIFENKNNNIELKSDNNRENPIENIEDVNYDKLKYSKGMRPDVLIHEPSNHHHNIFAAEVKKDNIDRLEGSEIIKIAIRDLAKILYLTHSRTDYQYNYGAVIASVKEEFKGKRLFWIEYCESKDKPKDKWNIECL